MTVEVPCVPIGYAPPAAAAAAAPSHRVAMFDAMRVVAAFAVIFTHTPIEGPWRRAASAVQFGVPFFTIAALVLLARSIARRPDQSFLAYAATRARRILGPLAVWTAIYVLFSYAMSRAFGTRFWADSELGGRTVPEVARGLLLGGAAVHLWFLPFILVACVGAFPALKLAHRRPPLRWWLVSAFTAAGLSALLAVRWRLDRSPGGTFAGVDHGTRYFLEYALWSLPTALWAVAIAIVYPRRASDRAAVLLASAGVALFVAATWRSWVGVQSPGIRAAKGVAVSMVALAHWSPRFVRVLARYGTKSFGVYLVHMIFVVLFREVGTRLASPTAIWFYPTVAAAAFVASYGVVVLFNRNRFGKALFP